MCDFVSWIEYQDQIFFLKNSNLSTKEGRELLKPEYRDDISGHGAIRKYYPELGNKGTNKECTDFSTPDYFPSEIVTAIKGGQLSKIGICEQILTQPALEQYEAVRQTAWEQYKAVRQTAWEQYEAVRQPAWEQYNAVRQPAWEQYNAVRQTAWEQYEAVRQPAWEQYEAVKQHAFSNIVRIKINRIKAWQ